MKKIIALIITVLLLTGCINVTIEVPEEKMEKVIDKVSEVNVSTGEKDETLKESTSTKWAEGKFELLSGIPPYPDPEPLKYGGKVQLKGWIIDRESYVGDTSPHFYITEESKKKFPDYRWDNPNKDEYSRSFQLIGKNGEKHETLSDEQMQKLRKYNEKIPATILVSGYNQYMEGTAVMFYVEILE